VTRHGLLVTVLLAACSSPSVDDDIVESRQAFVGGQPETAVPGAGYLVRDGVISCSGSLIEPDLVLTAAHCASEKDEVIAFGWGDTRAGTTVPVIARALHPRYIEPPRNGGVVFQGHDVALLRLERTTDITPLQLGSSPRGGRVHAIGYGATSYVENAGGRIEPRGVGTERRSAEGFVIGVNPTELFVRFDLGSSACYGDSGSPLLLADGTAVGVLSRFTGTTRCEPRMGSLMGYTRVDRMYDFFGAAKECLPKADVASCLREDERGLCDAPRFSNRQAPRPLVSARGDARSGVALFALDAHEERAFVVTPPDDLVVTVSAKGDAAMAVLADGLVVSPSTRRAELARDKAYELVMRSCNGSKQAVALAWRPLRTNP